VHIANRMTSQAKAKQIITTLSVRSSGCHPSGSRLARQIDVSRPCAARRTRSMLFEVLWQPEEATSMLPTVPWSRRSDARPKREPALPGQGGHVGDGRKSVTLGRAEDNDVVVKGNLISRLHARIESSRDKFTAGRRKHQRHVRPHHAGEEIFVRRDSTQLTGEGVIGLGRAAQPGTALAVHYVVEE
jgi:adenylate cyclase